MPKEILAIVDTPAARRTKEQAQQLPSHFRSVAPELKPLRDEIARLEKSRPEIPTLPVMVELPKEKRRVTKVLRKGNFLDPGDRSSPACPALHPLPGRPAEPAGPGDVARRPENPLTAGWPSTASGPSSSAPGSSRPRKTSAPRASCPAIPSCSTGWPSEFMELGLGHQGAAQADRHLGDLSAVVAGRRPSAGEGPAQPAAAPAARGSGSRPRWSATRPWP